MNCEEYKKYYSEYTNFPILKNVWETEHYESWQSHIHSCIICADWSLEQQVLQRGGNIADWPCVHMAYHATFHCEEHAELSECSKAIILYNDKFDEYCIGPRGGTGDHYEIKYCPICGIKLPGSKRDLYFERLDEMGLEYGDDRIPKEYLSSEWYKKTEQKH
jgi:hypothetical protein